MRKIQFKNLICAFLIGSFFISCNKKIKGEMELEEALTLTDSEENSVVIPEGEYEVRLKVKRRRASIRISSFDLEEIEVEFRGKFYELDKGEFDLEIENNDQEFRLAGEYSYDEEYLGMRQQTRPCIDSMGKPGTRYTYFDQYTTIEIIDATLMDRRKRDELATIKGTEIDTVERIRNETPCL